jgi:hypothetical protein
MLSHGREAHGFGLQKTGVCLQGFNSVSVHSVYRLCDGSRNLGTHDSALLTSIARHALHALYVRKLWLLAKPTLGGAFKVRATLPLNFVLNLT